MNCQYPCTDRATQTVTVLINPEYDADGIWIGGELTYHQYCTAHAAVVAEEIAHGNPPNVALVSVVALPPIVPAARGGYEQYLRQVERENGGNPPPATGPAAFSQFPGEWAR